MGRSQRYPGVERREDRHPGGCDHVCEKEHSRVEGCVQIIYSCFIGRLTFMYRTFGHTEYVTHNYINHRLAE